MASPGSKRRVVGDDLLEGTARDVLHRDVRLPVRDAVVVDHDDAGVVEGCDGRRLAAESLDEHWIAGQRRGEQLQRDETAERPVAGEDDLRHASHAQPDTDLVAARESARRRGRRSIPATAGLVAGARDRECRLLHAFSHGSAAPRGAQGRGLQRRQLWRGGRRAASGGRGRRGRGCGRRRLRGRRWALSWSSRPGPSRRSAGRWRPCETGRRSGSVPRRCRGAGRTAPGRLPRFEALGCEGLLGDIGCLPDLARDVGGRAALGHVDPDGRAARDRLAGSRGLVQRRFRQAGRSSPRRS